MPDTVHFSLDRKRPLTYISIMWNDFMRTSSRLCTRKVNDFYQIES